jgi:hypothetical protein
VNGALVGCWDASACPAYQKGGYVGFETDGIVVPVLFDDFGGGSD